MINLKNKIYKISGGIKFLIIVSIIYLIVAIFNISLIKDSLIEFWSMFYKIIPILLIAMIAMAIIDLYFTPERLQKYFGCNSGIRGWIYAIMLGILISGPPYILYPMLGELKKHGMKDSLLSVFLYNRNVKLQFLPVMVFYFGFVYTLLISIYIIIFSIIGGLIIKRLTK